jgi:hypothetical protein
LTKIVAIYRSDNPDTALPISTKCSIGGDCPSEVMVVLGDASILKDPDGTNYTYSSDGTDYIIGSRLSGDRNYFFDSSSGTYSVSSEGAPIFEAGSCGISDGGYFYDIPTEGLCVSGIPSPVSGDGPWIWTCSGVVDDSCTAEKKVDGVCGADNGIVTSATPDDLCVSGNPSVVGTDNNTVLLMHMDGNENGLTFNDQTGKAVTRSGNTKTVTNIKKFGTASVYLDGTGDYLSLADSDAWYFAGNDFTIEFWIYQTSGSRSQRYLTQSTSGATTYWQFYYNAGDTTGFYPIPLAVSVSTPSSNIPIGGWVHLAIVRSGSDLIFFINGIEKSRGTSGGVFPDIANPLRIGSFVDYLPDYDFQGYMDEIRISKGVARWTDDFVPPAKQYYWWNWTCNGIGGGNTATCGADKY